ncbi:MAG: DNA polymerase II large subunit, partial [Candidatus Parvarchaeota archaeon]|nr:DNA polymerase II large subunit [Candidatus Jingweiarchaeum tengchongense]
AFTVIVADYLRRVFGFDKYDPTNEEIERYVTEIDDYHRVLARLQYLPIKEEISFLVSHIPIEITGDPTSDREVSNYKDLKRVGTNRIRGGMCLVLCEGVAQKAKKILKEIKSWGKDFFLDEWVFLQDYLEIQKKAHTKEIETNSKIKPDFRFIEESVAGRPVFSFPLARGGFRLRYGRSRVSGLAACSIHPATMRILDDFIAIGSQLRVERPGKACAITVCDTIEGPVVKLKDGSVIRVENELQALEIKDKIVEILFLGDILVSYGDFLEQNHVLVPSGYVEEWWIQELEEKAKDKVDIKTLKDRITKIGAEEAVKFSLEYNIPLHPRYTYFWNNIDNSLLFYLLNKLQTNSSIFENEIYVEGDDKVKRALELICIPHKYKERKILIEGDDAVAFLYSIGFLPDKTWKMKEALEFKDKDILTILNSISKIKIRDKAPITIGARLGRPEKAKLRKLKGSPQVLFPVGNQGGRMRSFNEAINKGYVEAEFPIFFCEKCNIKTIYTHCEICGEKTKEYKVCQKCKRYTQLNTHCGMPTRAFERRKIEIKDEIERALKNLNVELPELVKGVRGTSNKKRIPERIEKGILRAIHDLYVNKDGTIRFDIIEAPITHFKPKEIGTSIDKLRELGYKKDIFGNEIVSDEQVIELKPQDVILPDCEEWEGASASDALMKICNFIDDLLIRFYKLEPFYNIKSKGDLVGHLIIGLAPHTSAGIVGRIIGFSKTQAYFAHPYFHAAMRRNCDGDEACFILLLDALLNFSHQFLPATRGASTMDAPLVLTTILDPIEVDKEVHNMDVVNIYPLEFYEATLNWRDPNEVKINKVQDRLKTELQYEGLMYTHDVSDINAGARVSSYKTLVTMIDKVEKQMALAEKILAVNKCDVARIIIEKHFLKDIKGNLREFSKQEFRCIDCNEKYRRIPLSGKCLKCGGKLVLTVAEGTVSKYLDISLSLAERYNLPSYLRQTLEIIKRRVESIFGKEKEKQTLLNSYAKS